MRILIRYSALLLLFLVVTAFSFHKFYVGVYEVAYAPEKKMLQITSRIFIDDLNDAIEKKYKSKTHIGTKQETAADLVLLKKYLSENFSIKVNGQSKPIIFLSKETEDENVLVCYTKLTDVSKIKTLEVSNTVLVDWNSEQQNITHFLIDGTKKTVLFTVSSRNEVLKY